MILHDCQQGSTKWLDLRMGIPTASEFGELVTPLWKTRTGQGPESYYYQKLCERFIGIGAAMNGTFAMDQGTLLESEAVPMFEISQDLEINRVGFCTTDDGRIGCSPDGLIGEDGGIEIKCPQPTTHLRYLDEGKVPDQYLAQVHGSMLVTGRKWWKFLSYSRQFPPLIVHVERDEEIQTKLRAAIDPFIAKLDEGYAKIKQMKDATAPRGSRD